MYISVCVCIYIYIYVGYSRWPKHVTAQTKLRTVGGNKTSVHKTSAENI